jgi:hypothetical protein
MSIAYSFGIFKKALKGFYRGLMKYSGTTFILDNAEIRLNRQRDKNDFQTSPNNQSSIDQEK